MRRTRWDLFWLIVYGIGVAIAGAFILLASPALAGGYGPAPYRVQDEGTLRPVEPAINFVGAGVSCVDDSANARTVCTIAGGAGSANTAQVVIDFGFASGPTEGDTATTVVTGAAWVTAASVIVCSLDNTIGTAEHPAGDDDVVLAQIQITVSTLVVGTGWTLSAYANDGTTGRFVVNCTGA